MADGSRSFNFPATRRSRLRQGENKVDMFACVAMICRLYRRDHRRALHMHVLTFFAHKDRAVIAARLRRAHRYPHEKVDDIDLVAIGVAA